MARAFITSLLQVDPTSRLTAASALSHAWLTQHSIDSECIDDGEVVVRVSRSPRREVITARDKAQRFAALPQQRRVHHRDGGGEGGGGGMASIGLERIPSRDGPLLCQLDAAQRRSSSSPSASPLGGRWSSLLASEHRPGSPMEMVPNPVHLAPQGQRSGERSAEQSPRSSERRQMGGFMSERGGRPPRVAEGGGGTPSGAILRVAVSGRRSGAGAGGGAGPSAASTPRRGGIGRSILPLSSSDDDSDEDNTSGRSSCGSGGGAFRRAGSRRLTGTPSP
jgi:hypothetical protein